MDVYRIQNVLSKKYFDDEGNEYTPIHSLRICSGKEKEVREIDEQKKKYTKLIRQKHTYTHIHHKTSTTLHRSLTRFFLLLSLSILRSLDLLKFSSERPIVVVAILVGAVSLISVYIVVFWYLIHSKWSMQNNQLYVLYIRHICFLARVYICIVNSLMLWNSHCSSISFSLFFTLALILAVILTHQIRGKLLE